MPKRTSAQFVLPLVCATLLFAVFSEADTDTWYQVELIVFSHPAGVAAEQWDATPDLAYPSEARILADEFSLPLVTTLSEESAPTAPTQPTAFTMLPSNQHALRGKAAAIQRSRRYQILFHEAWNQQVTNQASALPIILDRSGDGGAWPELQGTIKLYVARYLYLETNLWINTHGEYLRGSWRMPAPPLGPSSHIVKEPDLTLVSAQPLQLALDPELELVSEQDLELELASGQYPELVSEPKLELVSETFQYKKITAESSVDVETQLASALIISSEDIETLEPIYPFRHAILLQQKRRMRSGEVHYIDHPMLGIIVTITPIPMPDQTLQTSGEATSR